LTTTVDRLRRLANPAVVGPALVFVVVVGVWQLGLFHAIFNLKTFTVPYPDGIVAGIEEHGPRLLDALAESMPAAFAGYLAGIAGFALASLLMLAARTATVIPCSLRSMASVRRPRPFRAVDRPGFG
jgi:ABC-type nitrate/sulfonate/bicarbonate transport system permease component